MTDRDEAPIPLVEERITIDKRRSLTGRIRVRTVTETEETLARAELEGEAVEVTRVPVDAEITTLPEIRNEGDLTVVPVVEERLFVEKRLVLVEELHIRRRSTRETVEIPVTLRRQHAVAERLDPETGVVVAVDQFLSPAKED